MIQVDHMASATILKVLENLELIEVDRLLREMNRLEEIREDMEIIEIRHVVGFRLARASRKLRIFMIENEIEHKDWEILMKLMDEYIQKKLDQGLRDKVMSYREKIVGKNKLERLNLEVVFLRLRNRQCKTCQEYGHIAKYCFLTFDNVWEQMVNDEKQMELKKKLGSEGGEEINYSNERKNKVKMAVFGKEDFLKKYKNVFYKEGEKIQFCKLEKCKIKTKIGEKVVKKGVIVPQALRKQTNDYINDLENRGIIRRSNSEWRNPIRAIQKVNGKIRLVSNFMALNDLCEKDPYELRNIRDVVNSTQGKEYFTVLDLKEAFYSIEIEEKDKKKTAFEFEGRVFEWNSMVMGFKNAPQIMQRVMNKILEDEIKLGVDVYMDDVIISGRSRNEHDKLLKLVLEKFEKNNLKVNKEKMQFALGEVELLGVKINGKEQSANEIKKNEALLFPPPNNIKELRRFLGLAGWFRSFIPKFSDKTIKMTNSLKKSNIDWKWNELLNDEFENLKREIKNMKNRILPDYNNEFILKTDASNTGLGAVLMQKVDGKLLAIQWASKTLTDTESRYGISEKEMLAIFWGIKKFEYDLRGRKFKLITDHKALENIRKKPNFNNNRINRWIEKIQEFDFSIEYQKPENLIGPDALSRIDEVEVRTEKGSKILNGKINKHLLKEGNIEYWISDSGLKRIYPKIEDRKSLAENAHEKTNHRSVEGTYYELKQKYYWIGMKKTVENIIKKCLKCAKINRKNKKGFNYVETTRQLEKVGLDIMDLGDKKYILLGIDYYTRFVLAESIQNKSAKTVLEIINKWCKDNTPEEFITDNGKEFANNTFEDFCKMNNIKHRKVSPEAHTSNGRIERVIRTLREGFLKAKDCGIKGNLEEVVEKYNNTYHKALKMTPKEAIMSEDDNILLTANSRYSKYSEAYKRKRRDKFVDGDEILICKRENLGKDAKNNRGRFLERGVIVKNAGMDSYIICKSNGKLEKKRYFDIKKVY